jgi:putative Holliday junction resolvase
MGTALGIDYGTERIGLAASDALGITAQGLETIERTADSRGDMERIAAAAHDRKAEAVVVGYPLRMDGSEGPAAKEARQFAEVLGEFLGIPVHLQDERLTTAQAERTMLDADVSRSRRRKARDRMAAQIILQSFLDAHPAGRRS